METTKYIWFNGQFVPWQEANIHIATHALHYGGAAFEGIRVYQLPEEKAAILCLKQHIERLFYSAEALGISSPWSQKEWFDACVECVRINELKSGYLRPIIFYGYGGLGLNPRNAKAEGAILALPWGRYFTHEMLDVKIVRTIRIHPQSTVADAKISGHYVNGIMALKELKDSNCHEGLLLDYRGNVAEGPAENIFMVSRGGLKTPKLGTILAGITRGVVIELAKDFGIGVEEVGIKPEEIVAADEVFFTGTATEVMPIRSIDGQVIGNGELGPVTCKLRQAYQEIVVGASEKYSSYLMPV